MHGIHSDKKARSAPAASTGEIFRLLADGARRGQRGVLATIIGLTGTGARAVGTHMAVLENSDSAGSFSSGCVEAAIVAEAREVLDQARPRTVRFGQGSPYLDIKLPCGGGMDVLFLPDPSPEVLDAALARLDGREPVALRLGLSGSLGLSSDAQPLAPRLERDQFLVGHAPPLRLVLLGHGAEMLVALRLAQDVGAVVELYSPDEQVVAAGLEAGVKAVRLGSAGAAAGLQGDPWTAFLFLFHDHDWEPALIAEALRTPAFWIGAMGSRLTQQARRAALAAYGLAEGDIARVRGPVGLIPSSRDPATLALSALAEIVGHYRAVPE